MIYVILSAGFSNDSDNEFIKLLKIGYTKDKDRRIYQYISHNPTVKVLYEIPDCTEEIEDLLHSYFSKYRYPNFGKEWFLWDEEIINFFDTYKTMEDLLNVLDPDMKERNNKRRFNGYNKYVYKIIDQCLNHKMSLNKDYEIDQAIKDRETCFKEIDSSKVILKSGVLKSILKYFDIEQVDYEKYISRDLPEDIKSFLSNFNTLSNFHDKMKAICESSFNNLELSAILEQIPITFKNLYNQLGPINLKACGYNITNIKRRIEVNQNNEKRFIDVKDLIYSSFNIGERYSLIYIKQKLGELYNKAEYLSSPKATDLEKYFEVRKVQITNKESKKRDYYYEILSKKD